MAAIISATSLNAEALGLKDQIGSIAVDMQADIIAVSGDPDEGHHRAPQRQVRDEGRPSGEKLGAVTSGGFVRPSLKRGRMRQFLSDARFAAGALRRQPGFAAVVVATLALGIGANTALFSIVDAVLLRPLPFRTPDRLVTIWETGTRKARVAPANFLDWRAEAKSFSGMAGFNADRIHADRRGRARACRRRVGERQLFRRPRSEGRSRSHLRGARWRSGIIERGPGLRTLEEPVRPRPVHGREIDPARWAGL